jgi:hypothetical protein
MRYSNDVSLYRNIFDQVIELWCLVVTFILCTGKDKEAGIKFILRSLNGMIKKYSKSKNSEIVHWLRRAEADGSYNCVFKLIPTYQMLLFGKGRVKV